MILQFTLHAKQQMIARGITPEHVRRAITRGAITRQTDGYLAAYTYIRVAYKKAGPDIYRIKTVMIDERR